MINILFLYKMLFKNNFIKIFNKEDSHKEKINKIIKKLLNEYKIKDSNMIYIIESYNKQCLDMIEHNIKKENIKNKELINIGRKNLITKINKIKDKEFGIYQVLLDDLIKKLINNGSDKNILEIYNYESLKITNNINLIEKYKNILIIKLNENN